MEKKIKLNSLFEIKYINKISNIKYKKDLIKDSLSLSRIDNTFITFISKDKSSYIIYSTEDISINCFDFNKEKIIKSINRAHATHIMSFRYNYNKSQNKEYIVSVSLDKNIKLWEFPNFSCIFSIEKAHRASFIFSLCILSEKFNNYIISSSGSDEENIRVWDFRGNKLKEINNSKERTGFIDNYYSSKNDKYYIIIANYGNIKSFDFKSNELYKIYEDNSEEKNDHCNFVIYNKDEVLNNCLILIDSCYDGYIRLWDFDKGNLLKKIKCCEKDFNLRNICLIENTKFLFIICDKESNIKIIDLTQNKIITCIKVNTKNNELLTIKSIKHNLYGNCILTKGILTDNIKLWTP
jgi:WD40 repeat protein